MKKILIIAAAQIAFISGFAQAQTQAQTKAQAQKQTQSQDNLNRQMEVTRAYEPTVEKAQKVNITPTMTDTATLRPEISYSDTPTPINQAFGLTPIKAANINTNMDRFSKPLYIKAGLGAPFQSLLDVHYMQTRPSGSNFGGYANHYGSWSKIMNDSDIKAPANQSTNKIGLVGRHQFSRYAVAGELGYDYDLISYYGYIIKPNYDNQIGFDQTKQELEELLTTDVLRSFYRNAHAKVNFGNDFSDLSQFNFRIGVDADLFSSRHNFNQNTFKGYLDMGKTFAGKHEVTLGASYASYKGSDNLSYYTDDITSIRPLYRLKTDKFNLAVGFDLTLNNQIPVNQGLATEKELKTYFFPRLNLKLDITNGYFVPYLDVNGRLNNNGYQNTVAQNPYVYSGWCMPNTAQYDVRAGIEGSFSSSFSYRAYAGFTAYKNFNTFYLASQEALYDVQLSTGFMSITDDMTMVTIGGDIQARVYGSFSIEAALQYMGYSYDKLSDNFNMPNITAALKLKYQPADKWTLKAGGTLIGARDMVESNFSFVDGRMSFVSNRVGTMIDLSFYAQYDLSSKVSVFLNGNNLANQKIYLYNRYPSLGVNVMAGVKLNF